MMFNAAIHNYQLAPVADDSFCPLALSLPRQSAAAHALYRLPTASVPVYRLSNFLNICDSHGALIAIHVAFALGFCAFVPHNFMCTIPKDLTDAAAVDGASVFRIWWQVMLPLTRPALAALATLECTWKWNDYLWVITLIQSTDNATNATVTLGLSGLRGEFVTNSNLITAASLLAAIPTVLVYLVL